MLSVMSSKVIVFTCTSCRRKGTLVRRLAEAQISLSSMHTQLGIYERLLHEQQQLVECMAPERDALQFENAQLRDQLSDAHRMVDEFGMKGPGSRDAKVNKPLCVLAPEFVSELLPHQPTSVVETPATVPLTSGTRCKLPAVPTSYSTLVATTLSRSSTTTAVPTVLPISHSTPITTASTQLPQLSTLKLATTTSQNLTLSAFKRPPGFKELRDRVSKFVGDGREDFEVWRLTDFCEATGDCRWSDEIRAQWFSWFLTGSAKSTWQRKLNREEKGSWASIVQAYKSHYGVHMDPRTAYLRCHELQYQDFKFAQGLLEAMKDYQRMAPDQLFNNNLISIVWNKVPVTLQKEVGDWSLQELLQRLLRAEARLEERECSSKVNDWSKTRKPGGYRSVVLKKEATEKSVDKPPVSKATAGNSHREQAGTKGQDSRGSSEMSLKNVKCFKCNRKGHMAKTCPSSETDGCASRVITTDSVPDPDEDLWSHALTSVDVSHLPQTSVTGPTYKVDVVVEGLKTMALLDNGSQVSLVRAEMLSKIDQKNNWGSDKLSSLSEISAKGSWR